MTRGEYKYLPKEMIEELKNTKIQFKVNKDADAFKIIATNNRLAKELRFNLDFRWNKKND